MIGRRRRKVNPDQAPRDQHGRKMFHGAFTGGFESEVQVDDSEFISKPFYSSRTRRGTAQIQHEEDFMDTEDFDSMGRSQVCVSFPRQSQFPPYSEKEVKMLEHFGFTAADIRKHQSQTDLSHNQTPSYDNIEQLEWVEVEPPAFPDRYIPSSPAGFNPEPLPEAPSASSILQREAINDDEDDFDFGLLFRAEGENQPAVKSAAAEPKRKQEAWEPAKLLRQRFPMAASGKSAAPERGRKNR